MKYQSQLITGACIAALAFCVPLTASARAKKSASPSPAASASPAASTAASPSASPAKTERPIPFHGMISAVDSSAKTFTIAGKEKSRVFKITDKTVLSKAGNPATMKDVVANEEVRGSYWKQADGSLEAKSVKLGPPTEAEKAKEEARKSKKASASPSPAASAKP
jgi:hypothetical protein